jgi:4-amino-4-deoxychorismate lyase
VSELFCNGEPVDATLLSAALVNYGHFTSLQVRGGAMQGWALHMQRLQQGTRELFDATLDEAQLLAWLRQALQRCGVVDASVRITVFARDFDFRQPLRPVPVDVLIGIGAPAAAAPVARSVLPLAYQRDLPHIKHVGTFPLFHHRRQVMRQGFDDVLFVDAAGRISEGTTWNIAFWDGAQVVWPQAAALRGTSEQLLVEGLQRQGQAQIRRDVMLNALPGFCGAAACNASGLWPLVQIGGQRFEESGELVQRLQKALVQAPWLPL